MCYKFSMILTLLANTPVCRIALTLMALAFVHSNSAKELELFLGQRVLQAREQLSSAYSGRTSADIVDSIALKGAFDKLRGEFNANGGVDILGESSSVRWAWLSSDAKSWILQLRTSRKDWDRVEKLLLQSGWQKHTDGSLKRDEYIIVLGEEKLVFSRYLALEQLNREAENWSLPVNEWFSLRLEKSFFSELGARSPRAEAFVSNINEMYASWEDGDLVLNLQLLEVSQATAVMVALNGVIGMAKGAVLGKAQSPRSSWQMFDLLAYSSQVINALAFEQTLNRLRLEAFGRILQLRYTGAGDLDRFMLDSLPRIIGLGLIAAAPMYVEFKDQLPALLNGVKNDTSGSKISEAHNGEGVASCHREAKMIEQAVEFYNLDHLKKGKYENIKKELFENGYLPEELSCGERLVKDHDDFGTDSEGKIFLKPLK